MPIAILGKELAFSFWHSSWFLTPLILAALVFTDLFFALNYQIYTLLEKEDWPALIQELESKVLHKNRYYTRLVKLLLSSYLVLSDIRSVLELEKRLSISKKSFLSKNALSFGSARILAKDYQGAVDFFAKQTPKKGSNAEWQRWYFGFSLLLSRRFEEAADIFISLAGEGKEGITTGLSAYFLNENLAGFLSRRTIELQKAAEIGKERVKKSLRSRKNWDREQKRIETEVYAVILQSYIGKAADYLFRE